MSCKKPNLSGPLYKHLGHFTQQKFVDQGHNDSGKIQIKYAGSVPEIEFENGMDIESEKEDSRVDERVRMKKREAIDSGMTDMMMSPGMKKARKKRMMEE